MKRKITVFFILAMLIFLLSGCMQITYHITLNNNGTADVEYEMYMTKEYIAMIAGEDNADPFAENKLSAEAAGFTVEPVETETQSGFKATAKNLDLNFSNMVNSVGMGGDAKSDVQVKEGLFKNTYTVTTNIDTTNIMGDDEESQSIIPILNQAMDIRLIFTAPAEITSQTGTPSETLPNTYEYKIELGKNNEISLSYTLLNMTNIYIFAGIIIIILILVVFFLIKKFKKKPSDMDDILPESENATDNFEQSDDEASADTLQDGDSNLSPEFEKNVAETPEDTDPIYPEQDAEPESTYSEKENTENEQNEKTE